MWNAESGEALLNKEQLHEDDVTVASFFDQDKRIVTASNDGTVQVWGNAWDLLDLKFWSNKDF